MKVAADHPAKFSAPIITALTTLLAQHCPAGPLMPARVLDPFAGPGGVHQLASPAYDTVGIELEPEWALQHPRNLVGDATRLPFETGSFDAIITSPVYGNRLSDTYDGSGDRCIRCAGLGTVTLDAEAGTTEFVEIECAGCQGSGLKPSKRYTYTIALGRPVTPGSAAGLQWGPKYRTLHTAAWAEARRVLKPGGMFFLNISDHYRQFKLQGVDLWHAAALGRLGFEWVAAQPIDTQRSRNGANSELRDACEWILVFRRGTPEARCA